MKQIDFRNRLVLSCKTTISCSRALNSTHGQIHSPSLFLLIFFSAFDFIVGTKVRQSLLCLFTFNWSVGVFRLQPSVQE